MDFVKMLGKIKEMQKEVLKAKEKLDTVVVESESGGGMVRVKATASRKIMKISIDPDIINKEDAELMADLIAAAVNRALEKADEVAKEELSKVSNEAMPNLNIPGLDLDKFGL